MAINMKDIKEDSFMGGLMKAASAVTAADRARVLRKMMKHSVVPVPKEVAGCKHCVDRIVRGPEAAYPAPLIDDNALK